MSDLRRTLSATLGSSVADWTPVAGGDVNQAGRATLVDGTTVFVKYRADAPPGLYPAEARGLEQLAAAGPLRVPRVLAVRDEPPRFLALEWIEQAAGDAADHDEHLGTGLAHVHATHADAFGGAPSFLATIEQDNIASDTWEGFYRDRRLAPLVRTLADRGELDVRLRSDLDRLMDRLDTLTGPAEPPALLHGDLWGGNAVRDEAGQPVLIDPAVYFGHREMDLAMMRLFGGFGPRVFSSYSAVAPLSDGHEDRVELWQVWPLLVHAALFGPSWLGRVAGSVARYVR